MNQIGESDTMIMRYLDGRLSPVEAAQLSAELRMHPRGRGALRDIAEQAGAMAELARIRGLSPAPPAPAVPPANVFRTRLRPWQAIAALLVFGVGVALTARWWMTRDNRPVLEVLSIVGDLSWTGVAGQQREMLLPGERLPAGTFATAGEGAVARLRFSDATSLILAGNTRVALAGRGQKRAVLYGGILSADVSPQPDESPLIIETPTALLEVLGTAFFVSADADHTTLSVERGRVRLRRLADGGVVEVPAHHAVRASFKIQDSLRPEPTRMPGTHWRLELDDGPAEGIRGDWSGARDGSTSHLTAVPLLQGGKRGSYPVIHHGIGVREPSRPSAGSFVTLTPTSAVRLRYRVKQPATLILFMVTQQPGGQFGGNYEFRQPTSELSPDRDGWTTVSVPLSRFVPLLAHHPNHPAGNAISYLCVRTIDPEPELEVSELRIDAASP